MRKAAGLASSPRRRSLCCSPLHLSSSSVSMRSRLGGGGGMGRRLAVGGSALELPAPLALMVNAEFRHLLFCDDQCTPTLTNTPPLVVHVCLCAHVGAHVSGARTGGSMPSPCLHCPGLRWRSTTHCLSLAFLLSPFAFCQHQSWQRAALQTKGQ